MNKPKNTTEKRSRLQEALTTIQNKVGQIISSEQWQEALRFRRNFHNYSMMNTLLIWSQNRDSTHVAGYKKWLELGRQVRKGEKGMKILAPIIRPDPDDPKERRLVGFRYATVFDVSQTTGEKLPELPMPEQLTEEHPLVPELLNRAKQHAAVLGHNITYQDIPGGALGYYKPSDDSITLKTNLPPMQELKTLIHELAHAILGHGKDNDKTSRNQKELEAETTAFLTLDALGIDTSSYSFTYLAHWTDDLKTIITAGDRAAKATNNITKALQLDVIPTSATNTSINAPNQEGNSATLPA